MRRTFLLILLAVSGFYFTDRTHVTSTLPAPPAKANVIAVSHNEGGEAKLLTRVNFEDHIQQLYQRMDLSAYRISLDVFRLAMVGYYSLEREGALNAKELLTIIDFSQPSTAKRFSTIDLKNEVVKFHTYVAHGRNTGENMATRFSNIPHSNQSSLGFYVTAETYVGSKGYSLRLDGKEAQFNDKIRSRAVVMHAADYATEAWIKRYGRLGRSQGCPALPPAVSRKVIDAIKGGTAIFTYYPDETYLARSEYVQIEEFLETLDQEPLELAKEPVSVVPSTTSV